MTEILTDQFIRTLKTQIYNFMAVTSKHVYIDKFRKIVKKKYNNIIYRRIKMKAVNVEPETC